MSESLITHPAIEKLLNDPAINIEDVKEIIQSILDAEITLKGVSTQTGEDYIAKVKADSEEAIARINQTTAVKIAQAQHRWRSSIVWAVALVVVVLIIMTNLPK